MADILKKELFLNRETRKILDGVRAVTLKQDLVEVLKELDQDLVKGAVAGEKFEELFFANCRMRRLLSMLRLSDN